MEEAGIMKKVLLSSFSTFANLLTRVVRWSADKTALLRTIAPCFVLAFSLWVRLWYVEEHPSDLHMMGDMRFYEAAAMHLRAGNLSVWDTFLPVGYPAVLAAIYAVCGAVRHGVVDVVQACMGACTCVLAYAIAHRILRSLVSALAVGVVLALYAPLVLYTGFLLTETTFTFLVTLTVWLLLRAVEAPRLWRCLVAGISLGLGCIVRSNLLMAFPLLAVWGILYRKQLPRQAWKAPIVTILCAFPLLTAVAAHNTRLAGHPVGLATNGGVNFFLSRSEYKGVAFPNDTTVGGVTAYHNRIRYEEMFVSSRPAYDESYFYRQGLQLIAEDPMRILSGLRNIQDGIGLGPLREPAYWPSWMGYTNILNIFARAIALLGLFPALMRSVIAVVRKRPAKQTDPLRTLLWFVVLSEIATMYLFLGDPRGRLPFDPLIIILGVDAWQQAGLAGVAWWERRGRETPPEQSEQPPPDPSEQVGDFFQKCKQGMEKS